MKIEDLLICPETGGPIRFQDKFIQNEELKTYPIEDDISCLFFEGAHSSEKDTKKVQAFYETAPFPNYDDFDDVKSFIEKANRGLFAKMLSEQIPYGSVVLEVGCGTGQLSNYLAAANLSHVFGADMTLPSLRLATKFARDNDIRRVKFIQMNLFRPCFQRNSIDYLICNGVLHHTADSKAAFMKLVPLIKKGGFIILGLYNNIGRFRTDIRRFLFKIFGEKILFLDPHLRKPISSEKREAWIRDQYLHPVERKHSIDEVLSWFDEAGVTFVSSIPGILEELIQLAIYFMRKGRELKLID